MIILRKNGESIDIGLEAMLWFDLIPERIISELGFDNDSINQNLKLIKRLSEDKYQTPDGVFIFTEDYQWVREKNIS